MFKTTEQIPIQFDIEKSTVCIQVGDFQGGSNWFSVNSIKYYAETENIKHWAPWDRIQRVLPLHQTATACYLNIR